MSEGPPKNPMFAAAAAAAAAAMAKRQNAMQQDQEEAEVDAADENIVDDVPLKESQEVADVEAKNEESNNSKIQAAEDEQEELEEAEAEAEEEEQAPPSFAELRAAAAAAAAERTAHREALELKNKQQEQEAADAAANDVDHGNTESQEDMQNDENDNIENEELKMEDTENIEGSTASAVEDVEKNSGSSDKENSDNVDTASNDFEEDMEVAATQPNDGSESIEENARDNNTSENGDVFEEIRNNAELSNKEDSEHEAAASNDFEEVMEDVANQPKFSLEGRMNDEADEEERPPAESEIGTEEVERIEVASPDININEMSIGEARNSNGIDEVIETEEQNEMPDDEVDDDDENSSSDDTKENAIPDDEFASGEFFEEDSAEDSEDIEEEIVEDDDDIEEEVEESDEADDSGVVEIEVHEPKKKRREESSDSSSEEVYRMPIITEGDQESTDRSDYIGVVWPPSPACDQENEARSGPKSYKVVTPRQTTVVKCPPLSHEEESQQSVSGEGQAIVGDFSEDKLETVDEEILNENEYGEPDIAPKSVDDNQTHSSLAFVPIPYANENNSDIPPDPEIVKDFSQEVDPETAKEISDDRRKIASDEIMPPLRDKDVEHTLEAAKVASETGINRPQSAESPSDRMIALDERTPPSQDKDVEQPLEAAKVASETGINRPQSAESPSDDATGRDEEPAMNFMEKGGILGYDRNEESKEESKPRSFLSSRRSKMLIVMLCVVIIVVAIVVPVVLRSIDEEGKREIVAQAEEGNEQQTDDPVPTQMPQTAVVTEPQNTFPPIGNEGNWELAADSFTGEGVESFGSSVSIGTINIAVGAPQGSLNGQVFAYNYNDGTWLSEASSVLVGEQAGGEFGAALDMSDELLAVGAPFVFAPGTNTDVGVVYCYANFGAIDDGNNWVRLGSTLRGDPGIFGAYEEFGYAVAVSNESRRIAVGAPRNSLDNMLGRGRVYVFGLDTGEFDWYGMSDVTGFVEGGNFGSSVDISDDGSHLIAGAPGAGNGYASVYEWNGASWTSLGMIQGLEKGEAFGSAVKFLSLDGSLIAIGAPNHNGSQGRVVVYQRVRGEYIQVGPNIVGAFEEFLGAKNMISGGSLGVPSVILGTATGDINVFNFDTSSNLWVKSGETVRTFGSLNQVASSPQADALLIGQENDAKIYERLIG